MTRAKDIYSECVLTISSQQQWFREMQLYTCIGFVLHCLPCSVVGQVPFVIDFDLSIAKVMTNLSLLFVGSLLRRSGFSLPRHDRTVDTWTILLYPPSHSSSSIGRLRLTPRMYCSLCRLIVLPYALDIATCTVRRSHVHERPLAAKGGTVGEKWPVILPTMATFTPKNG
jgi:hypothetical protein